MTHLHPNRILSGLYEPRFFSPYYIIMYACFPSFWINPWMFHFYSVSLQHSDNKMRTVLFLATLLVCHYLADFCLTSPSMIRAKADGRNPWPILLHAAIHAGLMGLCLLVWGVSWKLLLILALVELITHFLIDTAKGQLTAYFPILADMKQKPYWMLYGFDQLLHLLVIVVIWYFSIIS